MIENDLISVIIPVKNGSNYLQEALDGLKKQDMNIEIIVVDDGSTDNTSQIAEKYGCKIVKHEETKGQVVAKNSGLKVATGKYVMFHDHDDVMRENALKRMYKELSSNPDFAAIEAKVQNFFSPEVTKEEREKTNMKKEPFWGLFSGAILMKRNVFDTIGLFSENISAGEVIEWQSKMAENGLKIKKIEDVSTDRRIHNTNFGKTSRAKEFKDYATLLRAKLKAGR